MFCALLTSRYQVSVYRTNGPLVTDCYPAGVSNKHCLLSLFSFYLLLHVARWYSSSDFHPFICWSVNQQFMLTELKVQFSTAVIAASVKPFKVISIKMLLSCCS